MERCGPPTACIAPIAMDVRPREGRALGAQGGPLGVSPAFCGRRPWGYEPQVRVEDALGQQTRPFPPEWLLVCGLETA